MLYPHFEITVTRNDVVTATIKQINNLKIASSWDTFTDTGMVKFPVKFKDDGESITSKSDSLFQRGDKIEIKSGYLPDLTTIFTGYITIKIKNNKYGKNSINRFRKRKPI